MNAPQTLVELPPPEFLQLAGQQLRWRLLGELTRTQRSVQELTGLVCEAQNLVSYHLARLRDGGLVSACRSSADGRDTYYTADLSRIGELLSATATALHADLSARVASPPSSGEEVPGRARVLFLCTGNSARSQMAEALMRERSGGAVEVFSAGSHPKPLHPNAVRVMREEHDLDLAEHEPKHLGRFADERFDWVISLCDEVREVCPEFPDHPEVIHWSIADPAAVGRGGDDGDEATYPAFRRTAAELDTRIGFLLAVINRTPAP